MSGMGACSSQPAAGQDLLDAARAGRVEDVKRLLGSGAAVSFQDKVRTICSSAHHRNCADTGLARVKRLQCCGGCGLAFASQGGRKPLHVAASAGHVVVVRLLLERGADVNARSNASHPVDPCGMMRAEVQAVASLADLLERVGLQFPMAPILGASLGMLCRVTVASCVAGTSFA